MSKPKKSNVPVYQTNNGVTLDLLKSKGHIVKIKHIRWAIYTQLQQHLRNNQPVSMRAIAIPSTFRKDENYLVLPKGGFTHITIKTKDNQYFCVSSECSSEETFCYRRGICEALNRLSKYDLQTLGF
jgi:hypothetical protein